MKITKEITFDMAHMLSQYDGKCNNLHGHTYKLQVTLDGNVNEKERMLLDFNVLKQVLNTVVMDKLDHAVAFSDSKYRDNDEFNLLNWAKTHNKRYVVIENGKTTCEDMAPWIRDRVQEELKNRNVNVLVSVKLWETPTSFAEC